MADYAYSDGGLYTNIGANTTTSTGQAVVTSNTNNTMGAYTQLVASTSTDSSGIILCIYENDWNDSLFDVAVGSAGSEQVIIPSIYFRTGSGANKAIDGQIFVPIFIPAGSRVAVRAQAGSGSPKTYVMSAVLVGGSFSTPGSFSGVDAIGVLTASSSTNLIQFNGQAANTKSSWVQLTASTTRQYKALILSITDIFTSGGPYTYLLDIGAGGAGSEVVVIPNVLSGHGSDETTTTWIGPLPIGIPSGTRLAFRLQASGNTASNWVGCCLYGLY